MLFRSQVVFFSFFCEQTLLFKFWAIVSRSSQREAWERRGRTCGIRYANIEADAANVTWGGGYDEADEV